jgi:hypothetical protein
MGVCVEAGASEGRVRRWRESKEIRECGKIIRYLYDGKREI